MCIRDRLRAEVKELRAVVDVPKPAPLIPFLTPRKHGEDGAQFGHEGGSSGSLGGRPPSASPRWGEGNVEGFHLSPAARKALIAGRENIGPRHKHFFCEWLRKVCTAKCGGNFDDPELWLGAVKVTGGREKWLRQIWEGRAEW